jgi:hypothetical protein
MQQNSSSPVTGVHILKCTGNVAAECVCKLYEGVIRIVPLIQYLFWIVIASRWRASKEDKWVLLVSSCVIGPDLQAQILQSA